MIIGVVGLGVVGQAHRQFFLERGLEVLGYDVNPQAQGNDTALEELPFRCDFIFVCVPTPEKKNEQGVVQGIDHSIVREVVGFLRSIVHENNLPAKIVLRSTVGLRFFVDHSMPDDSLSLLYLPEFLTDRMSDRDFRNPPRPYVLGLPPYRNYPVWSDMFRIVTKKLWMIMPANAEATNVASFEEAALLKLATNAYYATKIMFANSLKAIVNSQKTEGKPFDFERFVGMLVRDPRIGSLGSDRCGRDVHFRVAQDGKPGFGGKCLPKDIAELNSYADCTLLSDVIKRNQEIRGAC